jgi:hypothetical protein
MGMPQLESMQVGAAAPIAIKPDKMTEVAVDNPSKRSS